MKILQFSLSLFLFIYIWMVETKTSRIIGGETARPGQFPFSAAIYITTADGRYFCGGALISNQWILTAAQCVFGAVSFTIHLGSNHLEDNDPNRVILATSEYAMHPEFNPSTLENDVGLIKLRQPVMYSEYLQRILLAYDFTSDKTTLTGIGWGQTSDFIDGLSENLQFVNLVAISNDDCKVVYGNQISDHMICVAGDYNEGTCRGDTGSPLVDNDPVSRSLRHVGIASFISGNGCETIDPSGYTKTYSFREWIRNITSFRKKFFARRIIGGQNAYARQYPFAAAIYVTTQNSRFFCGGSLIGPEWVLTAGQCVNGAVSFTVHLGSNTLEGNDANRLILAASEYVLHSEFDPNTLVNDVGLIRLRMAISYTAYIQKVFMAYGDLSDCTDLVAIGWGQASDSVATLSNNLQYADVAAVSNTECKLVYGNQISDNMVCAAGTYNEGICTGDSGSPLLHYDSVSKSVRHVGIASFISANGCESTDPSGFTRTYSYKSWITNVTGIIT